MSCTHHYMLLLMTLQHRCPRHLESDGYGMNPQTATEQVPQAVHVQMMCSLVLLELVQTQNYLRWILGRRNLRVGLTSRTER